MELTFTSDSCVGGLKLKKCSFGPCDTNSEKAETVGNAESTSYATKKKTKRNIRSKEFPFGNIVRVPTLEMK